MQRFLHIQTSRRGPSSSFSWCFLGLLLCALCHSSLAEPRVVGYMPGYKNLVATVNQTDLSKLTHINIAFINPNANGVVTSGGNPVCMPGASGSDIHYLVQQAHQAGVKVLASIGGGVIPSCSGNWETLLQPGNRQNLVNNLLQFVADFNLDGIDVDIEGVLLTNIDNAGNYTPFIEALAHNLQPSGKLVTAATASYHGGMIPISSIPYFDFVNIMSYDAIGSGWGTPGTEHSTYAQAVADINTWKSRGLTRDKLVLGVPFYGWGFGSYAGDYSFAQLINQFGPGVANQDVIGDLCPGCSYITYNGKATIEAKTELALQEGSGVMIWEMSHDASGAHSLLSVIDQVISDSDGPGGTSCPDWVFGNHYAAGDVVRFEGGYYVAVHANPGYIPTVSTYFWDPVSGSQCGDSSSGGSFNLTIQAEDYTAMSGVQVEPNNTGGQNVGYIDAGDWMAYAGVTIPATGTYLVEYRVASLHGAALSLDLNAGTIQLGQVPIPATGGWQNWTTVSHQVQLSAGTFAVGIYAPQSGWNIDWFRISN